MSNYEPGTAWTKVFGYWNGFGNGAGGAGTGNTNNWEVGTKYFGPQALFNYVNTSGAVRCYISGWKVIRVSQQGNRYFQNNVLVSGSVGIGTTSPSYKLDVTGDINFTSTLKFGGVSVIDNTSTDVYANIRVIRSLSTLNDGMYIGYNSTGTTGAHLRFYVNGTNERMRIDASNGNVGIGTTGPTELLHVVGGNIKVNNSYAMYFGDSANNNGGRIYCPAASNEFYINQANNASLVLLTNNATRVTITGAGDVGINDTTPSYKLDVTGDIRATGDVIAYSDARVKDNVETITNALAKVISLRGVSYTRNDIKDKSRKVGVIAQEVKEILPEVVQQDDKGNYSVAYGNIVGVLIEAIKEQQKQINELKYLLQSK